MSRDRVIDVRDASPNPINTKPCTMPGCSGTMYVRDGPMESPPWPTHLEFPHRPVWVCAIHPEHTELLS